MAGGMKMMLHASKTRNKSTPVCYAEMESRYIQFDLISLQVFSFFLFIFFSIEGFPA